MIKKTSDEYNSIKILNIKFYHLKSGVTIISIIDKDGLEGIGQFINFSIKSQKNYFEELLKSRLINKKVNINNLSQELYWNAHGKNGWLQVISAIEIAAYDLISKSKKKSLSNFLSIKSKKVNKMYWSIGHGFKKSIYQMQKNIELGLKLGFKAFKIRMDWHELRTDINLEKDFKMTKAIRKMLPKNYYLGFDANGGYSANKAIYQGKKLEDLGGISHFEEPVSTNDIFALKKVIKSLKIPVSFGEYEKTANRFIEIVKLSNLKIIQPDLLNIGGISEFLKLFMLTKNMRIKIMPHCPDVGIISFTSLHMSNFYSNLPHEFSPEIYKYKLENHNRIFNENILPINGNIILNEYKHGIGLTLNKKELKKQLI